ncbi:MAG TPA: serine/threonine-protein kinase [Acidimicrobiales bacterium]|nr:serine/threonine-protein kinase [Acidimicrobiales bacterium]
MPAVVGDYELEREIGAGAAGTVWRAYRRGPVSQVVALKRLRAGSGSVDLARLRREAQVLTELDHPHIVRVLDVVTDGDGVALAMQYAPGGSLEDLLAARGRLAPGEVVAVAAPVADALASAHRRGVLHGDVKPANVLFTSDGEPLLTDFGVARTLGWLTSDDVGGTPEYLAPEQLNGAQPDPRADVYSLAVTCYRALSGAPPFTGGAPLAVVAAADAGWHRRLEEEPGVPPALARVVEQGMARDPGERFPTADAFARALRGALPPGEAVLPGPAQAGAAGPAGPDAHLTRTFGPRPPRVEAPAPRRRRRWLPPVAAAGLGAGVVVLLALGPLRRGDDGPHCGPAERPDAAPGAQVVAGDPDGGGCRVFGTYELRTLAGGVQRMVLTIEVDGRPVHVGLGDRGDQVVLGDWDCDGRDTPALYRRTAGLVQYFDVWPTIAQQEYRPRRSDRVGPGGTAKLAAGKGGDCDRVTVTGVGQASSSPERPETV